ncbi:hypothetical protein PC118_g5501 [Phytophthora cactorum]|uniref:Uncharacterized protein n=1 Tax=Phytophthora cactorum TaxID=29920 RepID=A0A8T1G826_9STRA|nr:hypothetical protein PC118_g5501 [Phytophthora cactorum]
MRPTLCHCSLPRPLPAQRATANHAATRQPEDTSHHALTPSSKPSPSPRDPRSLCPYSRQQAPLSRRSRHLSMCGEQSFASRRRAAASRWLGAASHRSFKGAVAPSILIILRYFQV